MANIFLAMDASAGEVTNRLKAIGSTDPDVLYAAKTELGRTFVRQEIAGTLLIVVGALVSLTRVLAPVGLLLVAVGLACRHKGIHNREVVEAAHRAFLSEAASQIAAARGVRDRPVVHTRR